MERKFLKKISYSLRIGIIGNREQLKEIFLESLASSAIKSNLSDDYSEFLIVFKQIPVKNWTKTSTYHQNSFVSFKSSTAICHDPKL